MTTLTPENQQAIHDLRTRILKKEPVTAAELNNAITLLRATRAQRVAAANAEGRAEKSKRATKATVTPMSMSDVNDLFANLKKKPQ